MTIPILYEDNDCLVIDKPAGIVVNRAESVKGETVQDWVEKNLELKEEKESDFYKRSGIVHRIDKETSGILLIAKNPSAFATLQKEFKEREVEKRYTALVHGLVKPESGEINAPVGRLPWNRERFGVFPGGKEAKTSYSVKKYFQDKYTFLEVHPYTGRTHQIRVHLKYLNHPIVGDEFYAGRKTAKDDRKWCQRLFLHSSYLKFKQPTTGKSIEVESRLPKELLTILENFNL